MTDAVRSAVVRFSVPADLLLHDLLRLPAGVKVLGCNVMPNLFGDRTVDLILTVPGAPPGAVAFDAQYVRDARLPDPVELLALRWLGADGREIIPPAAGPAGEPAAETP
jgi:hypothetical protein